MSNLNPCEVVGRSSENQLHVGESINKISGDVFFFLLFVMLCYVYIIDRTYPTHRMFMGSSTEAKEGRAALFRVLATYARYNQSVQYCQG